MKEYKTLISSSYPPSRFIAYLDKENKEKIKNIPTKTNHKSRSNFHRKRRVPVKYVICEIVK